MLLLQSPHSVRFGVIKLACLYVLTSPSGKQYIGIAKDAKKRWSVHKSVSKTTDNQTALYQSIRKYGFDSFEKKILVIGEFNYVKELEPKAIIAFGTKKPNGYNLTDGGDGMVGYEMSDATKALMSEKTRIRMQNPEHIEKLRAANVGKKYSAEVNAKKGRKGRVCSMKGKKISPEVRDKIIKALIGNTYVRGRTLSEEHKTKLSVAMKGRVFSGETKEKMRQAQLGKTYSDEVKLNMSMAAKAREANRRLLGLKHHRSTK